MHSRRTSGRRTTRQLGLHLLAACGVLFGCQEPLTSPNVAIEHRVASKNLADIADARVTGSLRGAEFTAVDVRLRVITLPGRERVDLIFFEEAPEQCGLPVATPDRRMWLRWAGEPVFDGAPLRIEAGTDGPFTAHYETQVEGRWLGHKGASALVSMTPTGLSRYAGKLWACFDDESGSCVSGSFDASPCRSDLDVDDSVWGSAGLDSQYPSQATD